MKTRVFIALVVGLWSGMNHAGGMQDDPLLTKVMIGQLEYRSGDGKDPLVWDIQGWVGKDLHKFWFKTEGERVDGKTEEAEIQLLYSRAIAPYWDAQIGWRRDARPGPGRDWLAIGVKGLAPYFFEVDAALFFGEGDRISARLNGEYEMMFTQRLILGIEGEVNFFSRNDPERGLGSGLSDIELGLRLRYEIKREFAPYIGINWVRQYGNTAKFTRAGGGDPTDTRLVIGIRAWF